MNSRWTRALAGARRALPVVVAGLLGCGGGGEASSNQRSPAAVPTPQAEAELLGRELVDIVDRVMAYRSSHRGNLPVSYRQAGIDTLTSMFVRRLTRQGREPLVTILFRRTDSRVLQSCEGTNVVLEDKLLRDGAFDVTCRYTSGATGVFTVPPPPPPPKKED